MSVTKFEQILADQLVEGGDYWSVFPGQCQVMKAHSGESCVHRSLEDVQSDLGGIRSLRSQGQASRRWRSDRAASWSVTGVPSAAGRWPMVIRVPVRVCSGPVCG
jgi:hypothetical protein